MLTVVKLGTTGRYTRCVKLDEHGDADGKTLVVVLVEERLVLRPPREESILNS